MINTPGEFYDIGKKARDLLHKDYAHQPRVPIHFDYRSLKSNTDISCRVKDIVPIVPELSTLFSFVTPNSGKVEMEYLNGLAGISGGIGLIQNDALRRYDPIANLSGVIGRGALFSFGTDLAFDISTGTFNKFNAGLSLNSDFVNASLSLDSLDSLKASCHCLVNPLTKTAIAAELKHSFSGNDSALVIGAQHAFTPSTLVKGRISTHGKVGALIRQGLWERIFLSVSGEVDFTDTNPNATLKIGLSLAVRLQMNII
ncbi:mitochondrial outer membrane protein porin of 36 kDa-like [Rosa sericea]